MEEIKSNDKVLIDKVELANLKLQVQSYDCSRKLTDFVPIDGELWKPIPKCKHYFISNLGRVRKDYTYKNGNFVQRIISPLKINERLTVEIRPKPEHRIKYYVHNLVALEFLTTTGKRGKVYRKDIRKMKVSVKDGNYLNCCVDNLFWQSRVRNIRKRIKPSKILEYTNKNGEVVRKASAVSNQDCIDILNMRKSGISQRIIAEKFKITQQMVSTILKGKLND